MVGEPRQIVCARVVPPASSRLYAPAFAVAMVLELSRRAPTPDDHWAVRLWAKVAPRLSSATQVRPGRTGSICVVWSLERPDALATVAERALELRRHVAHELRDDIEFRGGIALGVVGLGPGSDAVERSAERLALAAAPGQWLVSDEVARRLDDRFQFRPVGPCSALADGSRRLWTRTDRAAGSAGIAVGGQRGGARAGGGASARAATPASRDRQRDARAPPGRTGERARRRWEVLSAAAGVGGRPDQAGGGCCVPAARLTRDGPAACAADDAGRDERRAGERASGRRVG